MIGPHSATSARALAASSSGVEPAAATPSGSNLAFTAGSASIATASAFIRFTISGGVLAGTYSAYHDATSKPGTPDSAMVGISGAPANRFAVVTASPRT